MRVDAEAGVGLANRRLAIIELSPEGHQPMLSSDGCYPLTFNGEICNHAELRVELHAAGLTPEVGWRDQSGTSALRLPLLACGVDTGNGVIILAMTSPQPARWLSLREPLT